MSHSAVLSVYYKHKQGGFTQRLYRAYEAIATSGQPLIYIATAELPIKNKNIQAEIIRTTAKEGSALFWFEFYWRAVLKMRQLTRLHNSQQHFVFSFFYATISILSSVGLPVRTITLIRGDDVFDARFKRFATARRWTHRLLEYVGVRGSAEVLATSDSMRDDIARRTGSGKIRALPNDIMTKPLSLPTYRNTETLRLVTVSVLNERKNLHLVINSLARLKHFSWEYLIIGSDTSQTNYGQTLKNLAAEQGLTERIRFLGWQDNIASSLQDCHLFVFPTLMEGSPNALMEAMGYGLPCIASRIPEVTEVLRDKELHFDPESEDELVAKLEKLLNDADYVELVRQKTVKERSRYVFDWDEKITQLLNSH